MRTKCMAHDFDFPFEKDCLYVRGESPYEYLYIHIGDDERESFMAYFKSHTEEVPAVFQLRRVEVSGYTEKDCDELVRPIQDLRSLDMLEWRKAKMIETVIPGKWKQTFRVIRENLQNKQLK